MQTGKGGVCLPSPTKDPETLKVVSVYIACLMLLALIDKVSIESKLRDCLKCSQRTPLLLSSVQCLLDMEAVKPL